MSGNGTSGVDDSNCWQWVTAQPDSMVFSMQFISSALSLHHIIPTYFHHGCQSLRILPSVVCKASLPLGGDVFQLSWVLVTWKAFLRSCNKATQMWEVSGAKCLQQISWELVLPGAEATSVVWVAEHEAEEGISDMFIEIFFPFDFSF